MEKYMDTNFWTDLLSDVVKWLIYDLPVILVIFFVLLIMLRVNRLLFRRLNKLLVSRARKYHDEESNESEKRINTLTGILKGLGRIFIWMIFGMIILRRLGLDIAPLLAGAGILGLAVGFGAQELVRDFISGFFILLENQIREGDVVRINGTAGLVERIELRTTTLRDVDGIVHIFQNGKINDISNLTKEWSAISFDIGVAYKENTDRVMEVMKEVGGLVSNDSNFSDMILEPIEVMGLDNFGDSAIIIKARIKTKPGSQWVVGREYRRRLKEAFDREGIEIPFPHITLFWGTDSQPLQFAVENIRNG
jgi:moderate conductance mechanosensitive channel